jgi:hypothetical protein
VTLIRSVTPLTAGALLIECRRRRRFFPDLEEGGGNARRASYLETRSRRSSVGRSVGLPSASRSVSRSFRPEARHLMPDADA